jgi:hypothetical protein
VAGGRVVDGVDVVVEGWLADDTVSGPGWGAVTPLLEGRTGEAVRCGAVFGGVPPTRAATAKRIVHIAIQPKKNRQSKLSTAPPTGDDLASRNFEPFGREDVAVIGPHPHRTRPR